MLELLDRLGVDTAPSATSPTPALGATGKSCLAATPKEPPPAMGGLAAAVLNEVDYPIMLVAADLRLLFSNRMARLQMREGQPLQAETGWLQARGSGDQAQLRRAVEAATQRGLRGLVALASGVTVAVVPLRAADGTSAALLMLAKPGVCQELTLQCYAREQSLTPGETLVLGALCSGEAPEAIARQRGVALSTVRSQIGSLRTKTGAKDIGALVRGMALLPPLVNALLAA